MAHMSLASCYTHGRGVTQSYEKAFQHHLKASESGLNHFSLTHSLTYSLTHSLTGLPVALYNVGGHYFAGKGVELSFKKAADYYQQAADLGFAPAQVRERGGEGGGRLCRFSQLVSLCRLTWGTCTTVVWGW